MDSGRGGRHVAPLYIGSISGTVDAPRVWPDCLNKNPFVSFVGDLGPILIAWTINGQDTRPVEIEHDRRVLGEPGLHRELQVFPCMN